MDGVTIPSPRKRKVSNPSEYKSKKIKLARLIGGAYVNHKGNEVAPKRPGFTCHTFFMAKHTGAINPVNTLAYPNGKVALKMAKVADIKQLSEYIPPEYEEFYNELYSWPTTAGEGVPDSDFEEEQE